jgi:hypothetical protein
VGVKVFTLDKDARLLFDLKFGSNLIYSRSHYPKLLEAIRDNGQVVLTSNPGIGKSMFQFYYLARICNKELLQSYPLPQDSYGSIDSPEVVIRQIGRDEMCIYFIKAQTAFTIDCNSNIFKCFDPK